MRATTSKPVAFGLATLCAAVAFVTVRAMAASDDGASASTMIAAEEIEPETDLAAKDPGARATLEPLTKRAEDALPALGATASARATARSRASAAPSQQGGAVSPQVNADRPGVVCGVVELARSVPVANTRVRLTLEDPSRSEIRRYIGTTDESGRFAFGSVPNVAATISASRSGHSEALVEVPKTAELVRRVAITLDERRSIEVKCSIKGGGPAAPALAKLTDSRGPSRVFAAALLRAPGAAMLSSLASNKSAVGAGIFRRAQGASIEGSGADAETVGTITLLDPEASFVAYVAYGVVLGHAPLGAGDEVVIIEIDPARLDRALGTLEVVVVERESGAPIEGAKVHWTKYGFPNGRAEGETDAEGRFVLEGALPGEQWLWVESEGNLDHGERLVLPPGELLAPDPIRVGPSVRVAGRVVGPAALDLDRTLVNAGRIDPVSGEPLWSSYASQPDTETGEFKMHLEPGARYAVRAKERSRGGVPGHLSSVTMIDVAVNTSDEVELRMSVPSSVRVSVPELEMRPAVVRIVSKTGAPLATVTVHGTEPVEFFVAERSVQCICTTAGGDVLEQSAQLDAGKVVVFD